MNISEFQMTIHRAAYIDRGNVHMEIYSILKYQSRK